MPFINVGPILHHLIDTWRFINHPKHGTAKFPHIQSYISTSALTSLSEPSDNSEPTRAGFGPWCPPAWPIGRQIGPTWSGYATSSCLSHVSAVPARAEESANSGIGYATSLGLSYVSGFPARVECRGIGESGMAASTLRRDPDPDPDLDLGSESGDKNTVTVWQWFLLL